MLRALGNIDQLYAAFKTIVCLMQRPKQTVEETYCFLVVVDVHIVNQLIDCKTFDCFVHIRIEARDLYGSFIPLGYLQKKPITNAEPTKAHALFGGVSWQPYCS